MRRSLRGPGAGVRRSIRAPIRACIVSAARAHLVTLVIRHFDTDFVVAPIQHVVGGLIGDGILVAQLVPNVLEGLVQIVDVIGEKRAPTGLFREVVENLVAFGERVFAVAGFVRVRWASSLASARVCVDKLSSPSLMRIITRRTTSGWSPSGRGG